LRILAIVTEAYGGHGGIAQYNRDLVDALCSNAAVESVRILPRLTPAAATRAPDKARQRRPIFSRAAYAMNALGEVARSRPDLLICGHLYMAAMVMRIAEIGGVPFAVQLHGTEIWRPPTRHQRRALEKAAFVLCVSRHTRAQALRFADIESNRAVVIANTVGSHFRPGDRAKARAELGLADDIALLTVGRLDRRYGYKGHDRVIRGIPRLLRGKRPVTYLISGEGEDRPRLAALARDAGVGEHVRFLGFTGRESLPELYRAADVFAMPSTGEGFGIVFLEAMASGTPALGLAVGGALDPLDFGEWGRAVTEADFEDALCRTVAAARPDPRILHAAVNERFGPDAFARAVGNVFVGRGARFWR
jgi:phosphatidylinositol alpha-1,6-mannosyltransferase